MTTSPRDAEARAREPMAYFSHDANASQDFKCQKLLVRWGNEGYGAWWRLCEMLAYTAGHALLMGCDEDWEIVARQIGMLGGRGDKLEGAGKCKAFVHDLLEIGLLSQGKDGEVSSKRIVENSLVFGAKRAAGSRGGRPKKDAP